MTELVDRYISVAGVHTRYWQMGDQGSPVILLHGGNGSIEFWLYNLEPLAKHHRVYAFDMFGCGRSSIPEHLDYSLAAQAQFIKDFMTACQLEQVSLVGNSMGGGAASYFAHLFPTQIDRLVLSAPLGWGREINLGLRLLTVPGLLNWLRPNRAMIPAMLKWNFAHPENLPPDWMELRYEVFALPHRQRAIAAIARANLHLWGVQPSVYEAAIAQLPSLKPPTLVIWGALDRVLPVAHAQLAQQIPNHQLAIWPDCGHHPFLEFPDRFNQLVLNFLAN
jgi:4,5:9,10-diseco-3-hydroxy-5,9,17-trioxoandrosta-1(10),2-diene-4-oate hydrolase